MALVLAVEPDRRQASHIASMLRGRVEAELVIAESAARALDALAERVPDVLLTSPLLSWQDEAALAARLRELGPAAAHVQALTIPILATSRPPASRRGVLAALRRHRTPASTPAGCEPEVFAEQVVLYLQRAAEEREIHAAPEPLTAETETSAPVAELPIIDAGNLVEEAALPLIETGDLAEEAVAHAEQISVPEALVMALEPVPCDAEAIAEDEPWIVVSLDALLEVTTIPEPADDLPQDENVWVLTPIAETEPVCVVPPPPAPEPALEEPVHETIALPVADVTNVPDPPLPQPAARKKAERPKRKPVQDEWGLFDPDQCGFAALLDTLDEITGEEAAADKREDTTVRVVGY